ncbi:penicillin-binding protein [Patescibacteria group bacterium]|nr:penicillin-binding protein [Patescibacteria group bacterium]MCL5091994.1 penicillin-binding protein [Patescibacteria group bacterium]
MAEWPNRSTHHVPRPEERQAQQQRKKTITRRAFLFGGLLSGGATAAAAVVKREDVVKGISYLSFEKLAGDLRRHLDPDLFTVRHAPDTVQTAQDGDELPYPIHPPELVHEITVGPEAQMRLKTVLSDLYYDGIVNLFGADDQTGETAVADLIESVTEQINLLTLNLHIDQRRIDDLIPSRKIHRAVVDDKHAAREIVEFLLAKQPDQIAMTLNQPPYHEEQDAATGEAIAWDKQQEAALRRRRARQNQAVSSPSPVITLTPAPVTEGLGVVKAADYRSANQHKQSKLSRRKLLKILGIGIPAASTAAAVGATAVAVTDTTIPLEIGLTTILKEIDEATLWKTIEARFPALMQRPIKIPGILTVTDANGQIISQLAEQGHFRKLVKFSQIPKPLIDALTATEDGNFWNNAGVELTGIIRSLRSGVGGGSTLTQQLVKNLCWSDEENEKFLGDRTKKTAEILMAALLENQLERQFRESGLDKSAAMRKAKETIIEAYCNTIPFGAGIYGVKAASESLFGKNPETLTTAQATFLAGMPQGPSFFDPAYPVTVDRISDYVETRHQYDNITDGQYQAIKTLPENQRAGKTRQAIVINLMVKQGQLTPDQGELIFNEDLQLLPVPESAKRRQLYSTNSNLDHFAQYIRLQLNSHLPPELQGTEMTVSTSLDQKKQASLEKAVSETLPTISAFRPDNISVFVRNIRTGEVVATYGDQVTLHPPGSSVKPATYAKALELGNVLLNQNLAPDFGIDVIVEKDGKRTPWKVTNWGIPTYGAVNWKNALAVSLNCAAANTAMKMGTMQLADGLEKTGAYSHLTDDDSLSHIGWPLTLGTRDTNPAKMATMYGVFGNQGRRIDPKPIITVKNADGKTVYKTKPDQPYAQPVFDPEVAGEIADALGNNAYRPDGNTYTAWKPLLNQPGETPFFAKTGTAEPTAEGRHSWTVGVSGDLAIAVYVHTPPDTDSSGLYTAAPIFRAVKQQLVG